MMYYKINEKGFLVEKVELEYPPMIDTGEVKDASYQTPEGLFNYQEPVLVEDKSYVKVPPLDSLVSPRWDGEKWIESNNEPTEIERIEALEKAIIELGGVVFG